MRPSVGHVPRPPFLSFIAPLRFLSFSPACSGAKDLASRPLVRVRYQYHTQSPLHVQTPLRVTVSRYALGQRLQNSRLNFLLKIIVRKSSTAGGADNAPSRPRTDLPSHEEGRRSNLSKSFSRVMDHLQSNIFIAGQRLNDLTGYSGIEALKREIEKQGEY